jgi:hypothetical protein
MDPAVTQQHLGDPMASRHQIPSVRIVHAHQFASGVDLD